MSNNQQQHLNYIDTVNLGSYYTPEIIVDLAYSILQKNITKIKDWTILDSSCGYGSFLAKKNIAIVPQEGAFLINSISSIL